MNWAKLAWKYLDLALEYCDEMNIATFEESYTGILHREYMKPGKLADIERACNSQGTRADNSAADNSKVR
jgi:hypothetical protein